MANVEDDLSTPPVRLRAEIRKLRSYLTPDQKRNVAQDLMAAEALHLDACAAMQPLLCPICGMFGESTGCACACPGLCQAYAEQIIKALRDKGFRIERDDPERAE